MTTDKTAAETRAAILAADPALLALLDALRERFGAKLIALSLKPSKAALEQVEKLMAQTRELP